MPVELWNTPSGKWFWTCRAKNGEVISDSAEIYSTKQRANQGAEATAKEFMLWLDGKKAKTTKRKAKPSSRKKMTSGQQRPAGKGSTSSSSPTRKTGQRAG